MGLPIKVQRALAQISLALLKDSLPPCHPNPSRAGTGERTWSFHACPASEVVTQLDNVTQLDGVMLSTGTETTNPFHNCNNAFAFPVQTFSHVKFMEGRKKEKRGFLSWSFMWLHKSPPATVTSWHREF